MGKKIQHRFDAADLIKASVRRRQNKYIAGDHLLQGLRTWQGGQHGRFAISPNPADRNLRGLLLKSSLTMRALDPRITSIPAIKNRIFRGLINARHR
jgi:hypothetical protein